MISSGINLVMTVIGFAVSTMFIVFVCTRLICARIQLNNSRRSFAIASRSDLSILERGIHGLEPISLSNFPTKKYSDEFFSAADDTQCTVCLADYHHEDTLRILPYCGHSFHASCIDIWLLQHATCPVCRVSLRNFSDKKRIMQPLFSSALRMHRGAASYNGHSSHCPLSRENCPTHPGVRHRLDPVREDNPGSEDRVVAEVTESVIIAVEDGSSNQISGDKRRKQQPESPSNDGQVSSLS